MSRVGRSPVPVPSNVTVTFADAVCTVKGPKAELTLPIPMGIECNLEDGVVTLSRKSETKKMKSLHGMVRNKLNNLIKGVTEGFTKNLILVGTGYRAKLTGQNLEMSLGFSHPVIVKSVPGITFAVTDQDKVAVQGYDKELVGQIAANIRAHRKPEPYKGKGIRYTDEVIIKKAGKTSKGE